jgi:hypothetical protein
LIQNEKKTLPILKMRYQFMLLRMAVIKNIKHNMYRQGCGERRPLIPFW